jgi:hypothetical protein
LQDHAAILDSQLSQELGESYTGEWFDPASETIQIGITSGGYEQTVEQNLDNLGLADNTVIHETKHTIVSLEEAEDAVGPALEELTHDGLVMVGITTARDEVLVEKADDLTMAQAKHLEEVVAASPVPIFVIERPVPEFNARATSCSGFVCKPLRGGVTIQAFPGKGKTVYCSAGFNAQADYGSGKYLLTAGHCIADHPSLRWFSGYPGDPEGATREIGPGAWYVYGTKHSFSGTVKSKGDAGIVAIAPASEGGKFAAELHPWLIAYGAPGEPRREKYVIKGTHYNPQHDGALEKFTVCTSGVSGPLEPLGESAELGAIEFCGVTEGFRSPVYERGTSNEMQVHNVEKLSGCPEEEGLRTGDSGSPVFKYGRAYGLVSGTEGLAEDCRTFYEGVNTAESVLHVHVLKG